MLDSSVDSGTESVAEVGTITVWVNTREPLVRDVEGRLGDDINLVIAIPVAEDCGCYGFAHFGNTQDDAFSRQRRVWLKVWRVGKRGPFQ